METPNLEYIKQLSGGNQEFEAKIFSILKTEIATEIAAYQNAISSKNFKIASDLVHKIKHKVSFLGLEEGYEFSNNYEIALKNDDLEMKLEFDKILAVIEKFILNL